MARDEADVDVAHRLEPRARREVQRGAIFFEDRRVRGVAHEGLAEDRLVVAGDARLGLAREDSALLELGEIVRGGALEQRHDAARPEGLAEDGAGAEDLARLRRHAVEAELHQRLHREGQLFAPVGGAADELFQEERVAARAAHDVGAHRGNPRSGARRRRAARPPAVTAAKV